MANRNFASAGKLYSGHVMPVLLDCNFDIGATGAPSGLVGPYISSVSRLSAGSYKITAQDPYSRFYRMDSCIQSPSSGTHSGVFAVEIDAAPVVGPTDAVFIIQCFDASGVAVDPADGSKIFLSFLLSNSSVTVNGE